MALRLILVSMVAGLGLNPPSESELDSWTRSVQVWTEARLAEWNDQQRLDGMIAEANEIAPAAPAAEPGLQALLDEIWTEIASEETTDAPAPADEPAAEVESESLAFDAIMEEMVAGFVQDVTVADDRGDNASEAPAIVADEPAPSFEPLEVGDDLYPGLAYALNREADGIDEPGDADGGVGGTQLTVAIRLTRDAAYAWMNLLQSPAIVAISR